MDYLGIKDNLHWFECKICQDREACKDINAPVLPDEVPRYSMTEYRLGGIISKIYNK